MRREKGRTGAASRGVVHRNPNHVAKDAADATGGANVLTNMLYSTGAGNNSEFTRSNRSVQPREALPRLTNAVSARSSSPLTKETPISAKCVSLNDQGKTTCVNSLQLYEQPQRSDNQLKDLFALSSQQRLLPMSSMTATQPQGQSENYAGATKGRRLLSNEKQFGEVEHSKTSSHDDFLKTHTVTTPSKARQIPRFLKAKSNAPNEFVYLVQRPRSIRDRFNPYDLQTVTSKDINKKNYYTISAAGVTQFADGTAEFIDLPTWERGYNIFNKIHTLPVFRDYKRWHSFTIWRGLVRREAMSKSRDYLTQNLFHVHPSLGPALQTVRKVCLDFFTSNNLFVVATETLTVDAYGKFLQSHLSMQRAKLDKMIHTIRESVEQACKITMLMAQAERETTNMLRIEDTTRNRRKLLDARGHDLLQARPTQQPSHIEMAQRKAICQRLTAFIKLCDYFVVTCITRLAAKAITSLKDDLQRFTQNYPSSPSLSSPSTFSPVTTSGRVAAAAAPPPSGAAAAAGKDAKAHDRPFEGPLLAVDVVYRDAEARIELAPSRAHVTELMERTVRDYVRAVDAVPRLVTMEVFQVYTAHADAADETLAGGGEAGGGGPHVAEMVVTAETYATDMAAIRASLTRAFALVETYARGFDVFRDMYVQNAQLDTDAMVQRDESIEFFRERLSRYQSQMEAIQSRIPDHRDMGLIKVHTESLREFFVPSPVTCLQAFHRVLPIIAHDRNERLLAELQKHNAYLGTAPKTIEHFVQYLAYYKQMEADFDGLAAAHEFIRELFSLLQEEKVEVGENDEETYRNGTRPQFDKLRTLMQVIEDGKEAQQRLFSRNIDDQMDALRHRIESVYDRAGHPLVTSGEADVAEVIDYMTALQSEAEELAAREKELRGYQVAIGAAETSVDTMVDMLNDVNIKTRLWTGIRDWHDFTTTTRTLAFAQLDLAAVQSTVLRYGTLVKQVSSKLANNAAVPRLRRSMEPWRQLLPVLQALGNPKLRLDHRHRISAVVGPVTDRHTGVCKTLADWGEQQYTVGMLLDAESVLRVRDDILSISTAATEEDKLQQHIDRVSAWWNGGGPKPAMEFQFHHHKDAKDVYTIVGSSAEDVGALLDDSMMAMLTIGSSRYCHGLLRAQVDRWERRLRYMQDTLDRWLELQRSWIYLENIFASSEIRSQWKEDAKRFEKVDRFYRDFMRRVHDLPTAMRGLLINSPSFHADEATENVTGVGGGGEGASTTRLANHEDDTAKKGSVGIASSSTATPRAGAGGGNKRKEAVVNVAARRGEQQVGAGGATLLTHLQNHILDLENVLSSLERKLEEKRRAFPRFYFLSNDDLLDILAKVKTPEQMMPHMLKMFDGVKSLTMNATNEITHLRSMEGESVALVHQHAHIKARGPVEIWMDMLESEMFASLRVLAQRCLEDHEARRGRRESSSSSSSSSSPASSSASAFSSGVLSQEDRSAWMFSHPVQLVLMVEQLLWTRAVEEALRAEEEETGAAAEGGGGGRVTVANGGGELSPSRHMQRLRAECDRGVRELAALTARDLSKLQRICLSTLITLDVHGRDLVEEMCEQRVSRVSEFGWSKQLRVYWEKDTDGRGNLFIRQNNSCFTYGYEYLGAQGRLVITPLTDRIYMTVTGALKLYLGAAPAGPAGTGKTETIKDLAKNLARPCIVYNCSDGVTYKMMERFFAGLIQTGAWTCLDEFNRINVEVLSVIASQLLEIKLALQNGKEHFTFQGTPEVRVRSTYGAFITMNPGYAGRTELPDNLKILFRPVAVMTPDFRMIAEVILYSEGFTNAKTLSRKMTQLYKLSSEQLSAQDHYDFGMRALKSILVMAGDLKRAQPDVPEELTLIVACNDANVPKFVAEDVPLFHGIMQDLFPGVRFPARDYPALLPALHEVMATRQLVDVGAWLTKTIQFYETLMVRHGVMLVGVTCTGKTEARECMAEALTLLHRRLSSHDDETTRKSKEEEKGKSANGADEAHEQQRPGAAPESAQHETRERNAADAADPLAQPTTHTTASYSASASTAMYQPVHRFVLNPKSIKLHELYGELDVQTNEWRDGLLSVLAKSCVRAAETSKDHRWIVFDGPVDTLWIESLNSVLDDSKLLCLDSGERIKLPDTMHMLFEVGDLAVASPATVSRCGMVYLDAGDLPWQAVMERWLNATMQTRFAATPACCEYIRRLFHDFVPAGLAWWREQSHRIAAGELHVVQSLCELFAALLTSLSVRTLPPDDGDRNNNNNRNNNNSNNNGAESVVTRERNELCQLVFFFAYVWSVGGNVGPAAMEAFDGWMRQQMEGRIHIPSAGTVFDYAVAYHPSAGSSRVTTTSSSSSSSAAAAAAARRSTLVSWESRLRPFVYSPNRPLLDVLVPTVDTVRYGALAHMLLGHGRPFLLHGPTGLGKTLLLRDFFQRTRQEEEEEEEEAMNAQTDTTLTTTTTTSASSTAAATYPSPTSARATHTSLDEAYTTASPTAGEAPPAHHNPHPHRRGNVLFLTVLSSSFSAQTTAAATQEWMESKLKPRRHHVLGAPPGRLAVLFIDDLNMPALEVFGASPPLELLRQLLGQGGFYDRRRAGLWRGVRETVVVGACGPPEGGRQCMTPRLTRWFHLLQLPPLTEESMRRVFHTLLGGFVQHYPFSREVRELTTALVSTSVTMYQYVQAELRPRPATPHYTFNLRDLAKVFQGMTAVVPRVCRDARALVRLWGHEFLRCFHDRLVSAADRAVVRGAMREAVSRLLPRSRNTGKTSCNRSDSSRSHAQDRVGANANTRAMRDGQARLRRGAGAEQGQGGDADMNEQDDDDEEEEDVDGGVWSSETGSQQPVLWGDFFRPGATEKVYEELSDPTRLPEILDEYQDDYNAGLAMEAAGGDYNSRGGDGGSHGSSPAAAAAGGTGAANNAANAASPLALVFFRDYCVHLARVIRILRQPRGHALLIGVGGNGKRSLTQLAAHVAECRLFRLSVAKSFSMADFHEFLLELYHDAGVAHRSCVFMLSDDQIVDEAMLEDVNNILNSGEVPALFTGEEREKMVNGCVEAALQEQQLTQRDDVFRFFIDRVRQQLHVVLCMSPVGHAFRTRCRQFPSLTNCCSMDWFDEWPAEALAAVARRRLGDMIRDDASARVTGTSRPTRSAGGAGHDENAPAAEAAITTRTKANHASHYNNGRNDSHGVSSVHDDDDDDDDDDLLCGSSAHRTLPPAMARVLPALCVDLHTTAIAVAESYRRELSRHPYFITPTTYLEFMDGYRRLYEEQRQSLASQLARLRHGTRQMADTDDTIARMRGEIERRRPLLESASAEAAAVVTDLHERRRVAGAASVTVRAQQSAAAAQQSEASAMASEAHARLAEAKPIIDRAAAALDTIQASDLNELRSFANPPAAVLQTAQACMCMFDPKEFHGSSWSGSTDWKGAREFLSHRGLLDAIRHYPTENVRPAVLQRIQRYVDDAEFSVEVCSARGSQTCGSLCAWVHAVHAYSQVVKEVAPMRAAAAAASERLAETNAKLQTAVTALRAVEGELAALEAHYEATLQKKSELERGLRVCVTRLENATALSGSLRQEGVRWEASVRRLRERMRTLPVRCLVASASLTYMGALTPHHRRRLRALWAARLREHGVDVFLLPLKNSGTTTNTSGSSGGSGGGSGGGGGASDTTDDAMAGNGGNTNGDGTHAHDNREDAAKTVEDAMGLVDMLGDSVQALNWQVHGLPSDETSMENAIIAMRSFAPNRWPLLIDPQEQAKKWLMQQYGYATLPPGRSRGYSTGGGGGAGLHGKTMRPLLRVVKTTEPSWMRTLEAQVRVGGVVLIDDVGESIDAALEPLIARRMCAPGGSGAAGGAFMQQQQQQQIQLSAQSGTIDYHPDFRLFLCTKLANPHYLPDVSTRLTLINFTVTPDGLEDQMLAEVISIVKRAMEEEKNATIRSIAEGQKKLRVIEATILERLQSTEGNILDDGELIAELRSAQSSARVLEESRRAANDKMAVIVAVRETYRAVAARASVLFFVFAHLARVDPMYQYSLQFFVQLVRQQVEATPRPVGADGGEPEETVLHDYVTRMMHNLTRSVYTHVTQGLFNKDKTLFALLMASAIHRASRAIRESEWQYLVRATARVPPGGVPPLPHESLPWLSRLQWELAYTLAHTVPAMEGLAESLVQDSEGWRAFVQGDGRWRLPPPPPSPPHTRASAASVSAAAPVSEEVNRVHRATKLPTSWLQRRGGGGLTPFQFVLLVRCFREEKLGEAVSDYIRATMGDSFMQPPALDLARSLQDSTPATPIIFILSQGADPMEALQAFAASRDTELLYVSLGQGQGENAKKLIAQCRRSGSWVLLQNCHLSQTFMPDLEAEVMSLQQAPQQAAMPPAGAPQPRSSTSSPRASSAGGGAADEGAGGAEETTRTRTTRTMAKRRQTGAADGAAAPVHRDFRLWLTSMPTDFFPVFVLQSSIKLTNEPPTGLRANMQRCFQELTESDYDAFDTAVFADGVSKGYAYKKLLYGLCFFHSVIIERKKFGPLGWNVRYEWNDTDFHVSKQWLRLFFDEQDVIPWESLEYIVGQINYGGRVTDPQDRGTLQSILRRYLCPAILDDDYVFSESSRYFAPEEGSLTAAKAHIADMSTVDGPEVFGMHDNASLRHQLQTSHYLLDTLLAIIPRGGGGAGSGAPSSSSSSSCARRRRRTGGSGEGRSASDDKTRPEGPVRGGDGGAHDEAPEEEDDEEEAESAAPAVSSEEEEVRRKCKELQDSLPDNIHVALAHPRSFTLLESGLPNSMSTVLSHEVVKYNHLLTRMRETLTEMQNALQGLTVLSADLDAMYNSFLGDQVPQLWTSVSYASLKPLGAWYRDLRARVQFIRDWVTGGEPTAFWLGGFFNPSAFMTGVFQAYARAEAVSVDQLGFRFVMKDAQGPAEVTSSPSRGCYVYGIFADAWRWNATQRVMADPMPGQAYAVLPVIHFLPETNHVKPSSYHAVPLYRTTIRAGVISSLGASSNYVLCIEAPSQHESEYWLLKGAACICALDN